MMSKDTNAVPGSNERTQIEQIDLIDIIQQLWAGKKTISIFVVTFAVLALIYAFLAPQKWSSVAIVTLPDTGQVAAYSQAENVLYPNNAPLMRDIQMNFFNRFQGGIAALTIQLQNLEEKEDISSESVSKDQPNQIKIRYVGKSANEAQGKLTEYLKRVDSKIVTDIDGDLASNVNSRTNELKDEIKSLERIAEEKKNDRLKQLNQALLIAEQSKIKSPKLDNSSGTTDDTLFALGSDALNAMIENYKEAPLPLSSDYYSAVQNLLAVESIKNDNRVISTFRYIMKPSLPIRRDSPKKAIILIISIFIGGCLGGGVVLLRNIIRQRVKN
ncbi:LPS O-antigen chain length determinant protein WzzB [Mangrovibacter plantisponsor]|uniref:Chain length determinant protein n=1 Tax=Mangrovibacter plantisponsor TaxID=451513 RepID=A0A317Q728_9ENTR|nr:LPS O-antigen chain length determinant protein WzzB [Mangrovibacter plantisponsor]PWW11550.1 chain length determinant protein (polysaccharide antigen chain regulator) [Mangrovibacter plantisponsor]